jgi:hypothetical protein
MKIGALSLFNKTSSKSDFSIAHWHSSHSLTWRWGLSLRRHHLSVKPFAHSMLPLRYGHGGFGIGLGTLVSLTAFRSNDGWQFAVTLLAHSLDYHQQRPMWYRDLYRREQDRELEADFASQRPPEPPAMPEHTTLQ